MHILILGPSPGKRRLSEAEVRFSVTDPIIKGICRCTGTAIAAEEPLSRGEAENTSATSEEPSTPQGVMETPSHQKDVSRDIVPDYTIYFLASRDRDGSIPVIGMVEVKRKEHFDDRSICQTIGYHVARHSLTTRVDLEGDSSIVPPLLILICQDELKFIFLPFVSDGLHCIDAVVTPNISIFEDELINESWFSFVCLYIVGSRHSKLKLMDASKYPDLTLHVKKTYSEFMESVGIKRVEELEEEIEELRQSKDHEILALKTELEEYKKKAATRK